MNRENGCYDLVKFFRAKRKQPKSKSLTIPPELKDETESKLKLPKIEVKPRSKLLATFSQVPINPENPNFQQGVSHITTIKTQQKTRESSVVKLPDIFRK